MNKRALVFRNFLLSKKFSFGADFFVNGKRLMLNIVNIFLNLFISRNGVNLPPENVNYFLFNISRLGGCAN